MRNRAPALVRSGAWPELAVADLARDATRGDLDRALSILTGTPHASARPQAPASAWTVNLLLVRALGLEAERRGIELSPEVQRFLISRLSRDLASLMQLLERLDRYSLSRGRAVTVPLLRDMLAAGTGMEASEV